MIAAEGITDGLAKFLNTNGCCVASMPGIHCRFGRFTDVLRRDEVWFTDCEFEYVDATGAEFASLGGSSQSFGWPECVDECGCVHGTLTQKEELTDGGELVVAGAYLRQQDRTRGLFRT